MAPEIQEGVVFSPIRANQWSCGKTFLWFFAKGGVGDGGPKGFSKDLMNKNPAHRPSLIWSAERLDTACDDGDMDYVDGRSGNKESIARPRM
ncbi:hypothetical protein V8E52_005461, partial [Russula decolorans]